mgnify:CR=1 FL=1
MFQAQKCSLPRKSCFKPGILLQTKKFCFKPGILLQTKKCCFKPGRLQNFDSSQEFCFKPGFFSNHEILFQFNKFCLNPENFVSSPEILPSPEILLQARNFVKFLFQASNFVLNQEILFTERNFVSSQ